MAFTKVLITVKTYPTLSRSHTELVCTAGVREDGSWVRIYPSPFRFLDNDQRYRKYQWVELDLERNTADPRHESFRPRNIDDIRLGGFVEPGKDWSERRRLILEKSRVYTNLDEVIQGAKTNTFSLAVFKPAEIIDMVAEDVEEDWSPDKKLIAAANLAQGSLFAATDTPDFKLMPKLPVKFSYRFRDDSGKESKLLVVDWEIGQLYWNCLNNANKASAVAKVKERYLGFLARQRDLYLFLGTTRQWHGRAPNPYVIIGLFYPPPVVQPSFL